MLPALVLGALPRIMRLPRVRDACWMGLGLALMATSRPYEGLLVGIPVALMEAMAAGVPPVATRTGSIDELVDTGSGVLVPDRDPQALADALERLVRDGALRRRLGVSARGRIISEFETAETTRRLARLLGIASAERALVPSEVA